MPLKREGRPETKLFTTTSEKNRRSRQESKRRGHRGDIRAKTKIRPHEHERSSRGARQRPSTRGSCISDDQPLAHPEAPHRIARSLRAPAQVRCSQAARPLRLHQKQVCALARRRQRPYIRAGQDGVCALALRIFGALLVVWPGASSAWVDGPGMALAAGFAAVDGGCSAPRDPGSGPQLIILRCQSPSGILDPLALASTAFEMGFAVPRMPVCIALHCMSTARGRARDMPLPSRLHFNSLFGPRLQLRCSGSQDVGEMGKLVQLRRRPFAGSFASSRSLTMVHGKSRRGSSESSHRQWRLRVIQASGPGVHPPSRARDVRPLGSRLGRCGRAASTPSSCLPAQAVSFLRQLLLYSRFRKAPAN